MTRLQKIGLSVAAIGFVAVVFNFLKLYDIAGRCPEGSGACADNAYASWLLHERLALAVLVLGCVVLCIAWYRRTRRKP